MNDIYFQVYVVNKIPTLSEQIELINTAIETMRLRGYRCIGVIEHGYNYLYHFIKEK